jgi:hypothetical protein
LAESSATVTVLRAPALEEVFAVAPLSSGRQRIAPSLVGGSIRRSPEENKHQNYSRSSGPHGLSPRGVAYEGKKKLRRFH